MKTILSLLIVWALCGASHADTSAVLCGIRIVETQDQLHPPRGKLGERGPYQFRRATWRKHTSASFDLAENREVANTVAQRHFAWIEAQLRSNGIKPSAYNVAMAWNAGVNAVIRGTIPAVSYDYASRVVNIASNIPDENEIASSPPPAPVPFVAPVLVTEQTPTDNPVAPVMPAANETPTALPESASPLSIAAVVPADSPASPDLAEVAVRYHADPILLAFNRHNAPEALKDALIAQVEAAPNTLAAATGDSITSAHM